MLTSCGLITLGVLTLACDPHSALLRWGQLLAVLSFSLLHRSLFVYLCNKRTERVQRCILLSELFSNLCCAFCEISEIWLQAREEFVRGQAFVLDNRIHPQIPLLSPSDLACILAVSNPNLHFTAFSSSNIVSIYERLC